MNSMNGMVIDGIFASETPDSSGEILIVKGCDISDLQNGTAILNFEHRGESAPGHSPLDIIGKIIYAKKIFGINDCEDDRQKKYWEQVKVPFVYGQARLFDGAGHPGALAAAAMIRDQAANNERILLRYSIEGSTLERKGPDLVRSVARRVAATIKPCNRSCDSGIIADPQGQEGGSKNAEVLAEKLLGTDEKSKESTKKFEIELDHPGYTKLGHSPELEIEANFLSKGDVVDLSSHFAQKQAANQSARNVETVKQSSSDVNEHPFVSGIQAFSTPTGQIRVPVKIYDYTHLLPQEAQDKGLKLSIQRSGADQQGFSKGGMVRGLVHLKSDIGDLLMGEYFLHGGSPDVAVRKPMVNRSFVDKHGIIPILNDLVQKHALAVSKERLSKTLTAGSYNAAPSSLVGGSALMVSQPEFRSKKDKKKLLKQLIKAKMLETMLAKAEDEEDEDGEEERVIPLTDQEKQKIANSKVRIIYKDANGEPLKKPLIVDEENFRRFRPHQTPVVSRKGAPAFSAKKGASFDPETGILNTGTATMPLYIPNDEQYTAVLNHPAILKAHDEAMKNWLRLHEILKQGKISPEVMMYASLFSGLSPNNPVPMQEIAFSHLIDMIKEGKIDPKTLKGKFDWSKLAQEGGAKELEGDIKQSPEYQEFQRRVSGYGYKKPAPEGDITLPEHARSYWAGPAGTPTRYVEELQPSKKIFSSGVYQKGLFGPLGKFKSVAGFGLYKDVLEQLIAKHGTDGRSVARALHAIKAAADKKRARQQLSSIPELEGVEGKLEDPTSVSIVGLAPKTIRYALGMMGYGDMPVPDTHWTRHAFDLDRDKLTREKILAGLQNMVNDPTATPKDQKVAQTFLSKMSKDKEKANEYATMFLPHRHVREAMWEPANHDEMVKLDDFYEKNHPAIKTTAKRLYGDEKQTKNAVFPGFWLHWLTINPHESARRGTTQKVYNEGTHHVPYFMVMDEIHKGLGLEPLTSEHQKPYDPTAHKEQLATEHEAALGTRTFMEAPPKPAAVKKPKKLGKSEDFEEGKMAEIKKLVAANLMMERKMGEGYGQFYFYHQILPRLLAMQDIHKAEESSEKTPEESSNKSSSTEESETSWSKPGADKGMPKVSEEFIDTFEEVADDIGKIGNKKVKKGTMNKSELWIHELFMMSKLAKADELKPEVDPDIVQEHHIHPDTHPHAKELVLGMSLKPKAPTKGNIDTRGGTMERVSYWAENAKGHPFYIKGDNELSATFNHAAKEAGAVHLAHQLGLGEYFPHAALVRHNQQNKAAIEGILDLRLSSMLPPGVREKMHDSQNRADLHKLALFDDIVKNPDRHDSNYGFTPDGKIKMIDHGLSFSPTSFFGKLIIPDYMTPYMDDKVHPDAVKWLNDIDEGKAADTLDKLGIFNNSNHMGSFIRNLRELKQKVNNPNTRFYDLFHTPYGQP